MPQRHALLVEDDPFMRSAVADYLQEDLAMVVHTARSYEEARAQFNAIAEYCSLALVDISLPERGEDDAFRRPFGLDLAREIKMMQPACGVVLWSAYTHFLPDIMDMIADGRRGLAYVSKGSRVQVLQTAIEQVMDGDVFLHRAVLGDKNIDIEQAILASLDPEVARAVEEVAARLSQLSPRQMQVARRITLTPAVIARELGLKVRTVRNYQDEIYDRLGFRESLDMGQHLRRDPIIMLALLLHKTQQGSR